VASYEIVAGVDGGNSKTDVAIADTSGRVLGRSRGTGTKSPLGGAAALAGRLASLIDSAKLATGNDQPLAAAVFYQANLDLPDEEEVLSRALAELGIATQVAVGNDTMAVLRAGTDDGWGVAVVLGTGINAIGIGPDGQTERYLGIGAISGDWGGGHGIAVAGVGAGVRAEDGRGDTTVLSHTLPEMFGFATAHELSVAILRDTISTLQVLELTPLVFAAAKEGDSVARRIIAHQCDEVVVMITALLRRLGRLADYTPVILGGGVARGGAGLLTDVVAQRLASVAPLAHVEVLDLPPVVGAVAAALDLAGADRQAIHAVRTHNWD